MKEGAMIGLDTGFFVELLRGGHQAAALWEQLIEGEKEALVSCLHSSRSSGSPRRGRYQAQRSCSKASRQSAGFIGYKHRSFFRRLLA